MATMKFPSLAALNQKACMTTIRFRPHCGVSVIKKYGEDATNVGDEGGFAPNIRENKEGLELLKTAIAKAGYTDKVVIGMDVAASEFYGEKDKTYDMNFKEENNGKEKISEEQLKDLYKSFVSEYPIVSIEDPFDQDDWEHYAKMTAECGEQVQIVGDDLLVTNPTRVKKAIDEKTCNALLLKSMIGHYMGAAGGLEAIATIKAIQTGWLHPTINPFNLDPAVDRLRYYCKSKAAT